MTVDVEACIAEIYGQGFCILRDQVPVDLIDACLEAHRPLLEETTQLVDREGPSAFMGPQRYSVKLPVSRPFYDEAFFNNPHVLKILDRILGTGYVIEAYETDTPRLGSAPQVVHADLRLLFAEQPELVHPPVSLAVNFPWVDIGPENGPLEIAPGSHRLLPQADAIAQAESGELPLLPVFLKRGDILVRDQRCLHRGSANRSEIDRVVSVIQYDRSWYGGNRERQRRPLSADVWESLSAEDKERFRRIRRFAGLSALASG